MPDELELVGIAEIAELLGLSRQRVDQLSRSSSVFPKPLAELHAGRIWDRNAVMAWARSEGRLD